MLLWRRDRQEGHDDMINDLEKSDWQHLFSLPHNPRTPSETGKQQLRWGEATPSCRRRLWASPVPEDTLVLEFSETEAGIVHLHRTQDYSPAAEHSSDSGRDSLPGTLRGSQSLALRNQKYPTHATPGAAPSTAASGGVPISPGADEAWQVHALMHAVTCSQHIDHLGTASTV